MKLLTEELKAILPPLYPPDDEADPTVKARFFTVTGWDWWVLGGQEMEDDYIVYALARNPFDGCMEYGTLSIKEMEEMPLPRPFQLLHAERDILWNPEPVSAVLERMKPEQS